MTYTQLLVSVILIGLPVVGGYPNGAPVYQCPEAYPRHGVEAQPPSVPAPYNITADQIMYSPGDIIEITIAGREIAENVTETFRGFHVRVAAVNTDSMPAVGFFWVPNPNTTQGQSWYPDPPETQNCATHIDNSDKTEVVINWKAPDTNLGDLDITVTIVQGREIFWVGETLRLYSRNPVEVTETEAMIDEDMGIPNYDGCGETKGCLLYPKGCTGLGCRTLVSWQPDPYDADWMQFNAMAETEAYLAVGLSDDISMGDDSVVVCVEKDGFFGVQFSFNNPDKINDIHPTSELANVSISRVGEKLYCRYSRRIEYTYYYEDTESSARTFHSYKFTMLDKKHVLVATGPVYISDTNCTDGPVTFTEATGQRSAAGVRHTPSNTLEKCQLHCLGLGPVECVGFDYADSIKQCWINNNVNNYDNRRNDNKFIMYIRRDNICGGKSRSMMILKHSSVPLASTKATLLLNDTDVISASSMPMRIKVHATLGMVAWLSIAALSIIIARHYRFAIGCLCCGRGCWFILHAIFMVLVVFITIATVAVQFVFLQAWTEHGTVHGVLGLILLAWVIIQALAGCCRPAPGSGSRMLFNWIHRISGFLLFILSAVTIIFGVNVSILDEDFRCSQTRVVAIWIGFIILWEILLEILSCCARSTISDDSKDKAEKASLSSNDDGGSKMASLLFCLVLFIYLLVTLGLLTWSLLNLFYFF